MWNNPPWICPEITYLVILNFITHGNSHLYWSVNFHTDSQLMRLIFVAVQSLNWVQLFVIPWTAAHQALLSFTITWSFLRCMSIELVMISNDLILCTSFSFYLEYFPTSGSFPMSHLFLHIRWPKYWSFSISPFNEYSCWFPLWLTGLVSLPFKVLSRVFSSKIPKHPFFSSQPYIYDYWKNHSFDYMDIGWQSVVFAF